MSKAKTNPVHEAGRDLLEQLAYVEGQRKLLHEQFEDRIRPAKSEYDQQDAPLATEAHELRRQLEKLVLCNPAAFDKPRKAKSAFGEFGLQQSSRTVISNEATVVHWLETHGHEEAIDRDPHVKKTELRAIITAGSNVPDAHLETTNNPIIKVVPTVPDPE